MSKLDSQKWRTPSPRRIIYRIYKGNYGSYYILSDSGPVLIFANNHWRVLKELTDSRWSSLDVAGSTEITDLEFLVTTGVSRTEIEDNIKRATNNYDNSI